MPKPIGLELALRSDGTIRFGVTSSDRVTDQIWNAVEEAVRDGWSVDRFRDEAREAWLHEKREEVERDTQRWAK